MSTSSRTNLTLSLRSQAWRTVSFRDLSLPSLAQLELLHPGAARWRCGPSPAEGLRFVMHAFIILMVCMADLMELTALRLKLLIYPVVVYATAVVSGQYHEKTAKSAERDCLCIVQRTRNNGGSPEINSPDRRHLPSDTKAGVLDAVSKVQSEALAPIGHTMRFHASSFNDIMFCRPEAVVADIWDSVLQQQVENAQLGMEFLKIMSRLLYHQQQAAGSSTQ